MSFTVDTALLPAAPESHEAVVSVAISEEDLRRLQNLATLTRVGEAGAGSFAELLSATLRRGIIESCDNTEAGAELGSPGADLGPVAQRHEPLESDAARRATAPRSSRLALIAAAATTLIMIAGSYADHWTWTGFAASGQVWDWLQLLLLPVAIGTFPLWLRFSSEMTPARRTALRGAALACVGFVVAGYLVPLTWTGFRGHTLWNWMTLIVLPLTITTVAVWPKTGRTFRPFHGATAGALAMVWIVTVIGGYAGHWEWTGYPGNTLWQWLQLFLAPIAITRFVVPELVRLVAGDPARVHGDHRI